MPEEIHFNEEDYISYPQFNNRFKRFRNPERNWESMEQGKNEFSVHSDIAFEKHLKYLKRYKEYKLKG